MSIHVCNLGSVTLAANSPIAAIHMGATYRLKLLSLTFYSTGATAGGIAWGYKGAGTCTASTTQGFVQNDLRTPPIPDLVATAWSAPPVIPPTFMGRFPTANVNAAGNVALWQPTRELILDPSAVFVLWNFTATAAATGTITIEVES
jgi:hypothetical protein